jgi:hypothetical protein
VTLALITAGCVLFVYLVGRLRALLGAIALGVAMGIVIDPWEVSKLYVGAVWTVFGVIAIGLGLAVRWIADRLRPGRSAMIPPWPSRD